MKVDIVKRLRDYADDDHERLCQGREYTCSCGYDDKREPLITEAADEITALRARVRELEGALKQIDIGFVRAKDAPAMHDEAIRIARAAFSAAQEPLGAEFERVWDANTDKLYEEK